jgi:Protein of unknown function (DUF1761)
MQDVDLNYFAVVVAALVPMVLGAVWYTPVLFGRQWLAASGNTFFVGRPRTLYLIDSGYYLVSFLVMGAIHGVWD